MSRFIKFGEKASNINMIHIHIRINSQNTKKYGDIS